MKKAALGDLLGLAGEWHFPTSFADLAPLHRVLFAISTINTMRCGCDRQAQMEKARKEAASTAPNPASVMQFVLGLPTADSHFRSKLMLAHTSI